MLAEVSPEFRRIVPADAKIHIGAGFRFTEGPLWNHDGYLIFSDIPSNRIVKWQQLPEGPAVATFRYPSGNSNGLTYEMKS